MDSINHIKSSAVPIKIENIDTDQIIPARFLKAISREGFGDNLFRDWRYNQDNQQIESFSLNAEELSLTLWRLKESGFFEGASGFVFGRPCMFKSFTGIDYKRAVLDVLGELDVPIILDACIGHRGPQFSIINGSIGTFRSSGGKGSLVMELK